MDTQDLPIRVPRLIELPSALVSPPQVVEQRRLRGPDLLLSIDRRLTEARQRLLVQPLRTLKVPIKMCQRRQVVDQLRALLFPNLPSRPDGAPVRLGALLETDTVPDLGHLDEELGIVADVSDGPTGAGVGGIDHGLDSGEEFARARHLDGEIFIRETVVDSGEERSKDGLDFGFVRPAFRDALKSVFGLDKVACVKIETETSASASKKIFVCQGATYQSRSAAVQLQRLLSDSRSSTPLQQSRTSSSPPERVPERARS
jgi:hypothetical protein